MHTEQYSVAINPIPGKGEFVVLFSGNSQTPSLHQVGPQILDYHLLHYIVSGKGSFQCMGRDYALEAGSSFFIFPGEIVRYSSDEQDPWLYRWIGFKGTFVDQYCSSIGISTHNPIVTTERNRRIPTLFHQVQQTLQKGQPNCDMKAGGLLRILMSEFAAVSPLPLHSKPTANSDIQHQVEQAIRWLTLQYSQPVSIDNMARSLGYHRTYLSKMFKLHTGMSPMNFLMKIRMNRAKLLLNDPLTIDQVASSVGFSDALHFSKQFKKWYGSSPTEYRASTQRLDSFNCLQR